MPKDCEFILHPVHRIFVLRRDFHVVRPGDTAASIAAARAAALAETVRQFEERREQIRADWIAKGRDPADLDKPIFGCEPDT